MPIVDHDDVAFDVELRPPELPGGALERIAWQALRRHHRGSELGQQFMRHRDQSFADADDFALTNRHPDPRETWLLRRQKSDRLIVYAGELARAFDQLPMKFQVLFDTAPRAAGRRPPTHWTLAETLAHECQTNHIPRRVRPAAPPGRHVGWHAAVRDWPALPRRDAARQ